MICIMIARLQSPLPPRLSLPSRTMPKALNKSAQGCPVLGATLGKASPKAINPERVAPIDSAREVQRFQRWGLFFWLEPRVARSSQPWAGLLNAFGVAALARILIVDAKKRRTLVAPGIADCAPLRMTLLSGAEKCWSR